MRSFIVVLVFCVAAVLAGITEEQRTRLKAHKLACISETGVSEDVIEHLKHGQSVVFDEKLNCFSACMLKRIGFMRPDGSIDEEDIRSKLPRDLPQDQVDQVITTCKAQVGKDICETGGKVLSCIAMTKAVNLVQ